MKCTLAIEGLHGSVFLNANWISIIISGARNPQSLILVSVMVAMIASMDITIGLVDTPRELTIASVQGGEELKKQISDSIASGDGVLELVDGAGKTYLVSVAKVSYVQVGPSAPRQVGFIA